MAVLGNLSELLKRSSSILSAALPRFFIHTSLEPLTGSPGIIGSCTPSLLQRVLRGQVRTTAMQPARSFTDDKELPKFGETLKFGPIDGKKQSNMEVLKRFYRLPNGLWIHTQPGRHKQIHVRSSTWRKIKRRREHVICTKRQCRTLDLMVTNYWKKRRYYVNDPMEIYNQRNYNGSPYFGGPGKY